MGKWLQYIVPTSGTFLPEFLRDEFSYAKFGTFCTPFGKLFLLATFFYEFLKGVFLISKLSGLYTVYVYMYCYKGCIG